MPTLDPDEAARLFLGRRLQYHNAGRTFIVFTMTEPGQEPKRVEVTA